MPGLASSGLTWDEPLIFERSTQGRTGASLPELEVDEVDVDTHFGAFARKQGPQWPEVAEPQVMRHYVRLSQYNYAIDTGFYPLGSCTMKYNPKVNEWAARLSGFTRLHPYMHADDVQGALALMYNLERLLAEICGMDEVTLHPAAGAQGELTGLMMIRGYHRRQGRNPSKVLIPDTAHGTNPASCALSGYQVVPFPTGDDGIVDPQKLVPLLDNDVAALMITNPSTVGLFETELPTIASMAHDKGALMYGDGANLNALMGRVRPGDLGIDLMQFNLHKTFTTPHGGGGPGCGPVAFKKMLGPFAPGPRITRDENGTYAIDTQKSTSVGRLRTFFGNFGMMVRAYTYIREMGAQGLLDATDRAVLNANYLRVRLGEGWHVPFDRPCMHEVIISDKHLKSTTVTTKDVAKRLMDYGFYAPTVYFPLVVRGAMLIEPTETESKQALDTFVEAMDAIRREAETDPTLVHNAPQLTRLGRLDETQAARKPELRWTPSASER